MLYSSISQIGTFTALSDASADYLLLDSEKCVGGDDAPLRTTVEPAPATDGVLIFPPLDDAMILSLVGDLIVTSSSSSEGRATAEEALLVSLRSALAALKAAPDDLVYSGGSLKVWKYSGITGSRSGLIKSVTFELIVDVFA